MSVKRVVVNNNKKDIAEAEKHLVLQGYVVVAHEKQQGDRVEIVGKLERPVERDNRSFVD
jgi:hypothetical protein